MGFLMLLKEWTASGSDGKHRFFFERIWVCLSRVHESWKRDFDHLPSSSLDGKGLRVAAVVSRGWSTWLTPCDAVHA